jgi:hypothetical protein
VNDSEGEIKRPRKRTCYIGCYLGKGGVEVINSLSNATPAQGPVT